ncbi:MAG: glycosyltransferase family 2 protein [Dehalococcoidia bacterium]|jgi:GT2 family glycosyltransferase
MNVPEADHEAGASAEPPATTVIVLGFNGRHYLDGCFRSLRDQDVPRDTYELLYLDNGSSDGSASYVEERFEDVRVVRLDRNYGYADGNNIGFRYSRGRVIVFLNQDTIVGRIWLRELLEGLETSPDIGAAHANIIQPWYPEFAKAERRENPGAAYTAEVSRLGYVRYRRLPPGDQPVDTLFLHGVCIAIRREVIDQLDYIFDPEFFSYAEDLDLGLRLHALGYRTVIVPRAVVCHLHTLRTKLTPATFTHTVRIVRNRFLSFYKVMPLPEFLLAAPLIALGGPCNVSEFGLSGRRKLLYGLFLIPVTIAAVFVTIWQLRLFAEKRRRVLDRRSGFRCLPEMWRSRPGTWVSAQEG